MSKKATEDEQAQSPLLWYGRDAKKMKRKAY